MPNDWLDSRSPAHQSFGDATLLTADVDFVLVAGWRVVTAIAFVDVDAASLHAGELLHVGDHGAERVPVEGIAVQRFGMEHELWVRTRCARSSSGPKRASSVRLISMRPYIKRALMSKVSSVTGLISGRTRGQSRTPVG